MKADILIFDGNSLAHRVRHTISLTHPRTGIDVSILYGVLISIHKMYKKFQPESMIFCWDQGVPDRRYKLQPDYKRRDHKDDPTWPRAKEQMSILHENILSEMGVLSIRAEKTEADDLIARCNDLLKGIRVIVSGDQDMFQLISEHTMVYDGVKDILVNKKNFFAHTKGICLEAWLLYRALCGDSSDHIKGVPGIGPKAGKQLCEFWDDEEDLYDAALDTVKDSFPQDGFTKAIAKKIINLGREELYNIVDCMDLARVDNMEMSVVHNAIETGWLGSDWVEVHDWLMDQDFESLAYNQGFHKMVTSLKDPIEFANFVEVDSV